MARDLLKAHLRERFIVTLIDGESFSGLLDDWDGSHMFLIGAAHLVDGAAPVELSGRLVIPRPRIKYMQRPDGS